MIYRRCPNCGTTQVTTATSFCYKCNTYLDEPYITKLGCFVPLCIGCVGFIAWPFISAVGHIYYLLPAIIFNLSFTQCCYLITTRGGGILGPGQLPLNLIIHPKGFGILFNISLFNLIILLGLSIVSYSFIKGIGLCVIGLLGAAVLEAVLADLRWSSIYIFPIPIIILETVSIFKLF